MRKERGRERMRVGLLPHSNIIEIFNKQLILKSNGYLIINI